MRTIDTDYSSRLKKCGAGTARHLPSWWPRSLAGVAAGQGARLPFVRSQVALGNENVCQAKPSDKVAFPSPDWERGINQTFAAVSK